MFDVNGLTITTVEILDPALVTGAEYFNYFFTLIVIFAMFSFGLNVLVRLIARS